MIKQLEVYFNFLKDVVYRVEIQTDCCQKYVDTIVLLVDSFFSGFEKACDLRLYL